MRRQARILAEEQRAEYIITDGPPGIGCPVIAALSGVDLALIITEPSVAGKHDLERILQLTRHFGVKPWCASTSMICIPVIPKRYNSTAAGSRWISWLNPL